MHRNRIDSRWGKNGQRPLCRVYKDSFFDTKQSAFLAADRDALLQNIQQAFSQKSITEPNTLIDGLIFDKHTRRFSCDNENAVLPNNYEQDCCKTVENLYNKFFEDNAKFCGSQKFTSEHVYKGLSQHRNWLSDLFSWLLGEPKTKLFLAQYGLFQKTKEATPTTEPFLDKQHEQTRKVSN